MLNFYRVENMLNKGPYNAISPWDLNNLANMENTPVPEEDGLGDYWDGTALWTKDHVFGFQTMSQLTTWFNRDMVEFIADYHTVEQENPEHEFYVRGYEVKDDDQIIKGRCQAVVHHGLLKMDNLRLEIPILEFARDYDAHCTTA